MPKTPNLKKERSNISQSSVINCPVLGRRGLINFEVKIVGAKQDLHRAMTDLCWLFTQLADSKGKILVPNIDEGLVKPIGKKCWKTALSFHGIEDAFHGGGSKMVIPAKVTGKFSIRTGPRQKTGLVARKVDRFLRTTFKSRNMPNRLKTKYTPVRDITKP